MNVWEFSVPPCILCILLLFCLLYLSLLFSLLFFPFFFFWTELSWKLIKNVYLNRGPNKLMLQCPSLLHQMYMLFINWMYFICDNKLCWTWTWTWNMKWTKFCPHMERRTRWNLYTTLQLGWAVGIIILWMYLPLWQTKFILLYTCLQCQKKWQSFVFYEVKFPWFQHSFKEMLFQALNHA